MKETLLKKIEEMTNRGIEIRKELSFTLENLQDNPNVCIEEVLEYLSEHADRIEDYWLENYISELTFKPVIVIHMKLTEEAECKLFGKDHEGKACHPSKKSWLQLVEKIRDTHVFNDNPHMQ